MADDAVELDLAGRTVRVTHPGKVLFPERAETKLDLVEHYRALEAPVLRAMGGRPVLMQRFPNGATGSSFFQKRVGDGAPDWLTTTVVSTPNGTTSRALVIADLAHVLWAVNLGCLGFHVWPSRADDPEHADELRIDLDPQPGVGFEEARAAAREVKRLLDEVGLDGRPKTTGNRGIHVYVRLEPRWTSYQVRSAAVAVARELARRAPELITDAWWKEERGARIFVDFNQNAPHKTVFGAWSVRARPGAQVSTPFGWDELDTVDPDALTLATVADRVAAQGDPWADLPAQSLEPLLAFHERDLAAGLTDAPWPPVYPKMPNEPASRAEPGQATAMTTVDPTLPSRGAGGAELSPMHVELAPDAPSAPGTAQSPAPAAQRAAGLVDARIGELLDGERSRWEEVDPRLVEAFDTLREFVARGGKRLRPAFCYWAFVATGGHPDDRDIADVASALELLHTFALVHDDVMDGSHLRRGAATVHVEWERRHGGRGWGGDGRRFGEGAAILIGDLAFVYADVLLDAVPRSVRRVYDELRIELLAGQYLDVVGAAERSTDLALADRIARFKSAKYSVERPLHLGAALAGRLDTFRAPLTAFGVPVGEAFQLRDDLLGAFGDEVEVGKPVGDDFREGKPTPLVAVARERAAGTGDTVAQRVLDRVGDPSLDDAGVAAIREVLVALGARDAIETRITQLVDRALAALADAPLHAAGRDALAELARFAAGQPGQPA